MYDNCHKKAQQEQLETYKGEKNKIYDDYDYHNY